MQAQQTMLNGMRGGPSFGRGASLAVGALYMVAGLVGGLNVDALWALYAPAGGGGPAHVMLSALTVVFPHVLAIAGFILLVLGARIARRSFVAVALLPVFYAALCFAIRAGL